MNQLLHVESAQLFLAETTLSIVIRKAVLVFLQHLVDLFSTVSAEGPIATPNAVGNRFIVCASLLSRALHHLVIAEARLAFAWTRVLCRPGHGDLVVLGTLLGDLLADNCAIPVFDRVYLTSHLLLTNR